MYTHAPMQWLMSLLYPPLCIECGKRVENRQAIFCSSCAELLDLLDSGDRCPYCFHPLEIPRLKVCQKCRNTKGPHYRVAAAYENLGPARTLHQAFTFGDQPHLAKGASGAIAAQFLQLKWKIPDLVIPAPLFFLDRFEKGYNPSKLLAEGVASLLETEMEDCLSLSLNGQSEEVVIWKKKREIKDKIIVVIRDHLDFRTKSFVKALHKGAPKLVYTLGFCSEN